MSSGFTRYIQLIELTVVESRAVIEINPDALDIAARMDCERNQGKYHGPLHGIPFLVKDVCFFYPSP